jgi:hypothetical protein
MKKNIIISLSCCFLLLVTLNGCIQGLDNYDAPNGGIKGLILDEETNKPITTTRTGINRRYCKNV